MDLQQLIDNKEILYIYEIGLQIYGLFEGIDDRDFLLIVSDNFIITPELQDDGHFQIINIKDWFDDVLNNRMLAWICACLPKKHVIKEHVKLLLQTDPLKLRKEFDLSYSYKIASATAHIVRDYPITGQKQLWEIVRDAKFINQIIENHKIVNFKEVAEDYRIIVNGQISDLEKIKSDFLARLSTPLELLHKYTDGVLKASKIKKITQNG